MDFPAFSLIPETQPHRAVAGSHTVTEQTRTEYKEAKLCSRVEAAVMFNECATITLEEEVKSRQVKDIIEDLLCLRMDTTPTL